MALPFLLPLLGLVGTGAAVGTGAGIFSKLRKQPTQTQQITSTIKTITIIGGVLFALVIVIKVIK